MVDNFFFVALPYISLLLFFGGTLFRTFSGSMTEFRGRWDWSVRGDFLWTTRSTGFFGRASIGPAVLCLHWGLFILLVAHLVGFFAGAVGWASGVDFFRWSGMVGGMLVVYGATWAFVRRLSIPQLRAISLKEDYIVLLFVILIAGLGLYHSMAKLAWGVSFSAGPWIAGLFTLQPDASLMAGAPLEVKTHMILAMLFFAYVPFTKLVHLFSYPFGFMLRPHITMRSIVGLKR
ncbi:MAG: respiratory nitrate reductase subunit gamma [Candidatus Eremiobacterota bacterium]